ncbi:hypothetical protein HK104_004483 [Borealophlyctis nickersoniae]|nr:hypothetical protein HK104_004483 [Borealophlyctis nickersoniae]
MTLQRRKGGDEVKKKEKEKEVEEWFEGDSDTSLEDEKKSGDHYNHPGRYSVFSNPTPTPHLDAFGRRRYGSDPSPAVYRGGSNIKAPIQPYATHTKSGLGTATPTTSSGSKKGDKKGIAALTKKISRLWKKKRSDEPPRAQQQPVRQAFLL